MVKLKFRFTTVRFPFSRGRLAGAQIRGGGHRARVVRDCVKNFRDASARHHEVDALSELDLSPAPSMPSTTLHHSHLQN
jgi:hypothetical protein